MVLAVGTRGPPGVIGIFVSHYVCISTLGCPEGSVEERWTSSAQKRAGAVFAKVERRTKTPGVRTYRHLFVLAASHSAASSAACVA